MTQKEVLVKELEDALMDGEIDIAVHSLKDMPFTLPGELPIVAFTKREDARDVLLVRKDIKDVKPIEEMVIGTSSLRRKVQLESLYKGVQVKEIQGSIITRIRLLQKGEYDAIVLAAAGVCRAGLSGMISKYFDEEEIVPAAGQGILVVQTPKEELTPLLKEINDENAQIEATAERAYMGELGAGCKTAAGVYASTKNNKLYLTGMYYGEKSKKCYKESVIGYKNEAEKLGIFFANYMKRRYRS